MKSNAATLRCAIALDACDEAPGFRVLHVQPLGHFLRNSPDHVLHGRAMRQWLARGDPNLAMLFPAQRSGVAGRGG